jgi:hypothetical protein
MKKITLKSIWATFLNLFIGTIILGIISQVVEYINGTDSFASIFSIGILGSFIAFVMYGLIFLIPLILFQIITNAIFIKSASDLSHIGILLMVEFILIGILFTYFAIRHDFPSWYFFIAIFGISQYLRFNLIKKEIKTQPTNV